MRMAVVAIAISTGCMVAPQGPKSGAVPTGEPLNVVDDVKVWSTTYKEKVAETEYKDETGKVIGTGAVYQDRQQVHTMKVWYPVQGQQQVSDEDFFRIAGDKDAQKATEDLRDDGRTKHRHGVYWIAGGLVASIAGYVVPNATARTVLVLGGTVGMVAGFYFIYDGAHEMNPETHAVDRSIAERAAQQYNAQIGRTVGLGFRKSF